jgi:hypothetical protein
MSHYLITHQVFAQEPCGYVIRCEATIRKYLQASHTYLYQIRKRQSREICQNATFFHHFVNEVENMRKIGHFGQVSAYFHSKTR